MRIIHLFRSPVGGIFRHVRDLLGQQSANGHEVGIICDSRTGGVYEDRLFDQIQPNLKLGLHRTAMSRSIAPRDIFTLLNARRLIAELKPDIVHTHSAKGGIHGRFAAKLCSSGKKPIRTFYCPHGGAMHYDSASLKGRIFFFAERTMERFTDSLIFVSEYERNAYHEKVGTPKCDEAIVYNGLADHEFEPVLKKDNAADFLYIGMMRDLKGPDVFLDALHIAREKSGKNLTAMFVGDGPDKQGYLDQIERLGISSCVTVHDAMPAREAFAGADIVVVPSRAESMPYLVLEAAAAQKPVVATRIGGIPEIFKETRDDLVEPGNPEALATRMLDINANQNRHLQAREFSATLKERFSLSAMAAGVQDVYTRYISTGTC